MDLALRCAVFACTLGLVACTTATAPPPPPAAGTPKVVAAASEPVMAPPKKVAPVVAPKAEPAPRAPKAEPPALPASKPAPAAQKAAAPSPNPPSPAAAAKPAAPTPATAAAPAKPPLDLKSLEQRLKETDAIGVLTKLSLKNQVDDLVARFRAYHDGTRPPTLPQLRPSFELLVMKVLSLLQDKDPGLARDISASREAIWSVLADKSKLAQFT